MENDSERRKHPRILGEGPVFVKVIEAGENADLRGETIYCSTQDLSTGGIRLAVDREVPVGSVLHLWIGLSDSPGSYMLTGRVVWARPAESGKTSHMVGIEFEEVPDGDMTTWLEMMEQKIRYDNPQT